LPQNHLSAVAVAFALAWCCFVAYSAAALDHVASDHIMESSFGYGCVIDAGSSGSRIYIHRWSKDGEGDDLKKFEQEPFFADERHVGLGDEQGVVLLGEELLPAAISALPAGVDSGHVPIYLGATAGVRLASESEADDIMDRVRSLLHASGFLFQDDWARAISGDEESIFGWVVANYLRYDGSFPDDSSTYGALDLGGGSTQIALVGKGGGKDLYPLRIGTLYYPLYTESYLGLGADQARVHYVEKIVLRSSNINPCYPNGYNSQDIIGSSNWDECFDGVAKLFEGHPNLRGTEDEDAFADVVPPPAGNDQKYIAMSVFVFVYDFLGLEIGTETRDLKTVKDKAAEVCSMNQEEQTKRYDLHMEDKPPGRKTNKPFAQCFNAAFVYHLLSHGYQMPVDDTPIEVYYDINGGKVQWALGMMLVEANKPDGKRWRESAMGNTTNPYLSLVLVLLALILGVAIRSGRLAAAVRGKNRYH